MCNNAHRGAAGSCLVPPLQPLSRVRRRHPRASSRIASASSSSVSVRRLASPVPPRSPSSPLVSSRPRVLSVAVSAASYSPVGVLLRRSPQSPVSAELAGPHAENPVVSVTLRRRVNSRTDRAAYRGSIARGSARGTRATGSPNPRIRRDRDASLTDGVGFKRAQFYERGWKKRHTAFRSLRAMLVARNYAAGPGRKNEAAER